MDTEVNKPDKCSDLSSALEYNFNERTDGLFYYDRKNKTITKSKWGNEFYLDNYNCPFRSGKFHSIELEDGERDYIQVFQFGAITSGSLKHHNIIANLQYAEE